MSQLEHNSFSMNQMTLNINDFQHQLENKQKEGAALMVGIYASFRTSYTMSCVCFDTFNADRSVCLPDSLF